MATKTESLSGPRLWLHALYTVPQVDTSTVDPLARWLILGRVSVVVMSAISAVIGGLLAAWDDVFSWPLMILVAAGLILAHTGSNLVNDFWDYRHGIDTEESPRVNYGPHPLATKGTQYAEFVFVTIATLVAATVIGVYLTIESGPEVLIFALTGAALLLLYSGGPFPLKYIGLGEIAVFFIWGPLMIGGTYYVLAEDLPTWVLLASAPYGLGVTSVLFGKHLDKLDFDSSVGIRTAPIVLGDKLARYTTIAISIAMYISVAALAVWQEMWALGIVVISLPMLWQLIQFFSEPKPKEPPDWYKGGWPLWFVGMAFIHNRRFGMLFIGGLALQLIGEAIF
jgi:1,4-dihydroxy-2-naphthoate octaprenyltransferase